MSEESPIYGNAERSPLGAAAGSVRNEQNRSQSSGLAGSSLGSSKRDDCGAAPKHCVMISGGIGSYIAMKRVVQQYGPDGVAGLFANTKTEDPDLYRFLVEACGFLGVRLHVVQDGRNVWDVFYDGHCIGNAKVDLCSSTLKRDLQDKWRDEHCDPEKTTIHVGIDWTEKHRLDNARAYIAEQAAKGKPLWRYEAPLVAPPYKTKLELLDECRADGIEPPRLYAMGFAHNNCGGFCIKAGHSQFALLLRTMPERYAWHEAQEERVRQVQREHGVTPSTVLYHRRGGKGRVRITMREFREMAEKQPDLLEEHDWGGCGCGLPVAPNRNDEVTPEQAGAVLGTSGPTRSATAQGYNKQI